MRLMASSLPLKVVLLTGIVCCSLMAQHAAVDPRVSYQRILCAVPYTGKGTRSDPKRPMYVPVASSNDRSGIIGWTHVPSDDKTMAIVEFVALDQKSFAAILADKSVVVFSRGNGAQAAVQAALSKYKKDLDLNKFHAVVR